MYLQALIWFFVAFLTAQHAYAAPVVAAIAAFASTTLGGIIVNAAVGIALSVGASLLQSLFSRNQQGRDPGTTVQLRVGGANPLVFPVGRTATAGIRTYYNVWSNPNQTPNEYIVDVLAVSMLPLPGATVNLWMNDQRVTIRTDLPKTEQGWPIEEYFKNGQYYAWFDFHDGTQTTPNAYLLNKFQFHPNYPWTNDMIGRGVAYATVTARYDKDGLWSTGFPSCLIEIPSIPLYDLRLDSTNGGDGPMRWGQTDTYAPSDNAMVRAYNMARGVYYNNEWVYGGQNWPAFRLPSSSWIAAMNACDSIVGGEPQFHGGGMVECDTEIAKVIEELLRSASGLIAEVGGAYKVRVGAPGAPVMSFTDASIVVTREQGYTPFPGLEDTFNIARITYTEPGEKWAAKESPERRDLNAIASDEGRELPFSVDLPWVLSNATAQRIGKTALENGRRFRRHSMFHAPLFWLIEPLDVVAWTSAHNQYVAKEFDVERISGNSAMFQSVIIRENDPSDYNWNPINDLLPYQIVPVVPNITPSQVVTGWQVFPAAIQDNLGRDRRPSIEVRFDGNLTDIASVHVQVRLEGATGLMWDNTIPYPTPPVTTASIILNGDFPPNVNCEVRGRFIPYSDRDTEWTGWLAVTTPDIKLIPGVDFDPFEGVVGFDQLGEDLAGYQEWLGAGRREIERRLEEIETLVADQDLGNEWDRQSIRQQVTATYEQTTAEYTRSVDVVATQTQAIALRVEELDASVFDPDTGLPAVASAVDALETSVTTIDGRVTSQAQAITSLSASSDPNNVNEANFRMQVLTGTTGYTRIGAEGRQGGSGVWRTAGWYIDVPNNVSLPTRFSVLADQFVVASSATAAGVTPLIFDGTTLRIVNARIGWALIDNVVVNTAQIANGAITSAKIGDAQITSAKIGFLEVAEGNIADGAITNRYNDGPNTQTLGVDGLWVTIAQITVVSPSGNPPLITTRANFTSLTNAVGNSRVTRDGVDITAAVPLNLTSQDALPSAGTYVYRIQSRVVQQGAGSPSGTVVAALIASVAKK